MQSASLTEIQQILSFFNEVPARTVHSLLDSGVLRDVIEAGKEGDYETLDIFTLRRALGLTHKLDYAVYGKRYALRNSVGWEGFESMHELHSILEYIKDREIDTVLKSFDPFYNLIQIEGTFENVQKMYSKHNFMLADVTDLLLFGFLNPSLSIKTKISVIAFLDRDFSGENYRCATLRYAHGSIVDSSVELHSKHDVIESNPKTKVFFLGYFLPKFK